MADISDMVIRVKDVTKAYQIYDKPQDRLKQGLWRGRKQFYREFRALDGVSFEVKRGETVGIIGRNGSGKSTLLQIICGTLAPTSGTVEVNGRVAALLELGAGFNPEFTGRENIYMSASILGLKHDEIDALYDEIVAFSEIEAFIDQPVNTYSSGMYVRLAFAVNIVSKPQIMIVDEALSVGDMNFQAKCMTALTRLQQSGATVLFVSHDVGAVQSLCSRAVYLDHGTVKAVGPAPDVAELYVRNMREEMSAETLQFARELPADQKSSDTNGSVKILADQGCVMKTSDQFDARIAAFRYGTGEVQVAFVELLNMQEEAITVVDFNEEVKIRIYVRAQRPQQVAVNFHIVDEKKVNITGGNFFNVKQDLLATEAGGEYLLEYRLRLPLQEGNYALRVLVIIPAEHGERPEYVDVVEDAVVFQVARWAESRVWSKVYLFPQLRLTDFHDG